MNVFYRLVPFIVRLTAFFSTTKSDQIFRALWGFKFFGYFTYNQVHESREKLADAYSDFKVNATAVADIQWEGVTKRFLEWQWKFKARNVFKVDRNLVGLVFGTVFTYFIVVYNLKLEGQEASLKMYKNNTA
ncbi:unnamed protein product [Allacma fusca]|uniref:Uncharacterized protein n=1 Tax=Allacma fusca TaxID=39272 RepID=A0A8J2K639_9HEXA|nr:unnamed protein product [Allacma fusca]